MTLYGAIFYILGIVILASTALAITRRNPVHCVLYLIISFFGSAMLFYLLGAPFLAALEVIIYAGAIMVLFLFVIMTLKVEPPAEHMFPLRQWVPAILLGFIFLTVMLLLIFKDPRNQIALETAMATPGAFGRFIFKKYWLSIEIVSLLLLIALVAALQLGRGKGKGDETKDPTLQGDRL